MGWRAAACLLVALTALSARCVGEGMPPRGEPTSDGAATPQPVQAEGEAGPPAAAVQPPAAGEELAALSGGKRICLDPGHDANSPGASARDASGRVIFNEHDLTLAVAYRLKPLLEAQGFAVCVTRNPDGTLIARPRDENGNGRLEGWERAQAKIDYVDAFGARVFVSIHFNGISDPSIGGTEVYYADTGPHEEGNRALARTLLDSLVSAMRSAGYWAIDRGIKSDNYKPYGRLWVLGYNDQLARKAHWQAGALVEVLFLTSPADVSFLQRPDALDIVARALLDGVVRFWEQRFGAEAAQARLP